MRRLALYGTLAAVLATLAHVLHGISHVEGDRAFVRTWDTAWKVKRIRNNSEVEVAPSTLRGKPTGPAVRAHARILDGDESAYAGRAIARKHRILHGLLVPLVHRLRRNKTVHIELKPVDS